MSKTDGRLAHRIMQRMRDLDLTQEELADRVGVSQTTISKLITGKTERSRYIHDIAEVLQTTAAYLMWGKSAIEKAVNMGQGINPQETTIPPTIPHQPSDPRSTHGQPAPSHRMEVCSVTSTSRGTAQWIPTDHPTIPFGEDFFAHRQLDPARCRLLLARGDSMAPGICDGDVVMIDTGQTRIVDGQAYALLIDDELYLRRVTRRPGLLVLEAERVAPSELPGDAVIVLGRVVWRAG